ncbi:MAG: respiratory nitrate reductase subunit gamma [Clostridia bacterium]|nr:respiratory nitrate reductase subunit gamma [Clostridia bacterium]
MNPVSWFILQVLPYITVAVFVIGILYRLGRWVRARIVHNITLAPFPKNNGQVVAVFAKEVIFFRSLFKSDKAVWAGGWIMHVALFSVIGGHIMGIGTLGKQFFYMGMTTEAMSENLSSLLGTSFGIIVFAALIYLLVRRISITKVKLVSSPSDYLMLVLLILIVGVGDLMRMGELAGFHGWGVDYATALTYVQNLAFFQSISGTDIVLYPLFTIHLLLVQILLMVFPFSKLMHVLGMFGERWIINRKYKEPEPGLPNVDIAAARKAGLGLPSAGGEIDA